MACEILRDDGYHSSKLIFLAVINIVSLVYLFVYVLTFIELSVMTIIISLMFIIQVFTKIRIQRTLLNGALLLLVSVIGVICWQLCRLHENP